jgi:hypothetical protein
MHRLYLLPDDFEAVVRIYSHSEGGRTSAPRNGIRWDLAYAEDQPPGTLYMIWPDFHDEAGDSLPIDQPLPIGTELRARMTVVSDELRVEVHRRRIQEGTRFYCHEGQKRVAEGRVVRVTGLLVERGGDKRAT